MTLVTFLRDIVVPVATLTAVTGLLYITYTLCLISEYKGAASTALLAGAFGFFAWYDAKRLLNKIS